MKTLLVSTGLIAVLFLSASSNVDAQGKETTKPAITNPPLAQEKKPTANTIAQAMVKALKENPGGLGQLPALSVAGSLEGDEKSAYEGAESKALAIALATTGEQLSGMPRMQAATDIMGWFMSRRPLRPETIAKYMSRYKNVDKSTVEKWRAAQGKSGHVGNSPTLTLSAIVFQDFLWDGSDWKKGNPDRALTRLSSLSADAVSRWREIAKSQENEVYGAWTLLAVDDLFVNDTFQQSVFDAAFPKAQKLLSEN